MVLGLVLTACPRPLTPPTGMPAEPASMEASDHVAGRISFGFRRTQAGIKEDIAPGATVSLIDVQTGVTKSTTVTDADGKFVLRYSNGFKPVTGTLYYFEALKGLSAGTGQPNAAGGDAARVRTIARFRNGGWQTLTSSNAGSSILISPMTTALSIVVSLRSATSGPLDPTTLFGAIRAGQPSGGYPDTLTLPPGLSEVLVKRAYDLVIGALDKERDPVRWIQLSSTDPSLNTLMLPEIPFTVSHLMPDRAIVGEFIDLVGSNFDGDPAVYFQTDGGRIQAEAPVVSPDLTRIRVKVPPLAVTGHVELVLDDRTLNGPIFRLDTRDGHSVVDERGNLYAVNQDLGTLAILEPDGDKGRTSVRTLADGLGQPTALTFGISGYDALYVASIGGTISKLNLLMPPPYDKVTKVGYSGKTSYATGGPTEAGGMAFRNRLGDPAHGALYLTGPVQSQLLVVPSGGGIAMLVNVSGAALNQPRGLSFGPDGRLYVANAGDNNVLAITLTGVDQGQAVVVAGGFSHPWGIAFNSQGDCLVSNYLGNSVYKVPLAGSVEAVPLTFGKVTAFASIPTPAGLDADSSGYVYVADRKTNGIYRINSLQESQQIAFGVNSPTSTWVDATGLYILTESGQLLRSESLDGTGRLTVFAEGLLTARGLARDSGDMEGNFFTNQSNLSAITLIDKNGFSRQVVTGLTASNNTGLSLRAGKLYVRANQSFDPGPPQTHYASQGEVLEFTLGTDAYGRRIVSGPTDRLRSPLLDQWVGLGGNSDQAMITLAKRTRTFFRMAVTGTTNQAVGKRAVLTRLKADPALVDPRDLWVAPAPNERIWVADYAGGPGGTGSIRIYAMDGTFEHEITGIAAPTNLNYDGTYLYANSYTGGYLRAFDVATYDPLAARERTGFSNPRGFAFAGTTLYVNEWGRNFISQVANYATQTVKTDVIANADRNDIETQGSDILITSGADVGRIYNDGGIWVQAGVVYKDYDSSSLTSLSKIAGKIYAMDGVRRVFDLSESDHRGIASTLDSASGNMGYSGIHGLPTGWGLVSGTNFVSYSKGDSSLAYVIETALDGSVHRSYRLPGDTFMGGMVEDGNGTVYLTHVNRGTLYRLADNTLETFLNGTYGQADRMYGGISYHDGYLYQAIYTRHWIDRIHVTTKARTSLKMGLVTPEL
ncbi:Serine/threonine-protein kinase PknD [compost metagenome]